MKRKEEAESRFRDRFNCAQSVFSVFAPALGLDVESALRIASPFGSGMAYQDEVCGAVTGAIMVIGLMHGMSSEKDLEAKEKAYSLTKEFATRFKEKHGSLKCTELIGLNLSHPEEYQKAFERNVFYTDCVQFVRDAVDMLEEILCWTR